MTIFSEQGKKAFKWAAAGSAILIVGFFALRTIVFVVLSALMITHEVDGEVASPSGNRILTIYESSGIFGFQGSTTVFNLREKGTSLRFLRNNYWTGKRLVRSNDIVLIDGNFFPYGIFWSDENHLQIYASHLPGYRYKWALFDTSDTDMFEKHESRWKDVTIAYELIQAHPRKGEIRIQQK